MSIMGPIKTIELPPTPDILKYRPGDLINVTDHYVGTKLELKIVKTFKEREWSAHKSEFEKLDKICSNFILPHTILKQKFAVCLAIPQRIGPTLRHHVELHRSEITELHLKRLCWDLLMGVKAFQDSHLLHLKLDTSNVILSSEEGSNTSAQISALEHITSVSMQNPIAAIDSQTPKRAVSHSNLRDVGCILFEILTMSNMPFSQNGKEFLQYLLRDPTVTAKTAMEHDWISENSPTSTKRVKFLKSNELKSLYAPISPSNESQNKKRLNDLTNRISSTENIQKGSLETCEVKSAMMKSTPNPPSNDGTFYTSPYQLALSKERKKRLEKDSACNSQTFSIDYSEKWRAERPVDMHRRKRKLLCQNKHLHQLRRATMRNGGVSIQDEKQQPNSENRSKKRSAFQLFSNIFCCFKRYHSGVFNECHGADAGSSSTTRKTHSHSSLTTLGYSANGDCRKRFDPLTHLI